MGREQLEDTGDRISLEHMGTACQRQMQPVRPASAALPSGRSCSGIDKPPESGNRSGLLRGIPQAVSWTGIDTISGEVKL